MDGNQLRKAVESTARPSTTLLLMVAPLPILCNGEMIANPIPLGAVSMVLGGNLEMVGAQAQSALEFTSTSQILWIFKSSYYV
jgi:hypothetical protein